MLKWYRTRQEDKARVIVTRYLGNVQSIAAQIKEVSSGISGTQKSDTYCLASTYYTLDTTKLQCLLHTDNQGVMDWVNSLPEVRAVLQTNRLMVVYTHTHRRPYHTTDFPQHLVIVLEGSTPYSMTWPGR